MYKVVIVEDEALVRKGIVLTVDWESLNCVVEGEASNGAEGLEVVEKTLPDIVITDIKMPKMDGVEMIKSLKDRDFKIEFIIISAYSDFTYAHNAIKLGVSDYILKPFKDGELEKSVSEIVRKLETPSYSSKELLINLEKKDGEKSRYVNEAIQYIRKHYNDPYMSVSQVSLYLDISESYLSRIFKKETDYTFNSYLTQYRIHSAMNILKDCRVKVYEVAKKVGYSDATYFSTLFKKIVGFSPSEYQEKCG